MQENWFENIITAPFIPMLPGMVHKSFWKNRKLFFSSIDCGNLTKKILIHDWFKWLNRHTVMFTD